MTNKKITDLVELTTPTTDDVFPLVDIATNSTKKAQLANLPISTATQTALDAKQATLVSGTNIKTINSTSLLGSGDIAVVANPAGTAGQIQFTDGSAFAADSNLYWDNTNKRLGVGTNVPTATTHIKGAGNSTATTALLVQNSAGTNLLKVDDSGFGFYVNNDEDGKLRLYANGQTGVISGERNLRIISGGGNAVNISGSGTQGVIIGSTTALATNTALVVKGSGSTSATTSLLVQNSSGSQLLKVADNGEVSLGLYATPTSGFALNIGGAVSVKGANNGSDAFVVYVGGTITTYINAGGDIRTSGKIGLIANPLTALEASAKLQVDSTTQGVLFPRMTTTQKNAISTPAAGLMVYDTDTNKLCCYNGTTWNDLF